MTCLRLLGPSLVQFVSPQWQSFGIKDSFPFGTRPCVYIDDLGRSRDLTTREEFCEEWRQMSHSNDGLQPVIKINGYTIKRSNYDIIVFSLGNWDQPLKSFTPWTEEYLYNKHR